ncbi:MAG: RNA polymerase sigma factor RpoD/SigA [Elusimicrobiota bacterium]
MLYKRIRKGDEKATKRLVEGNLRLVVSIAAKYQYMGLSFLDLIEEGNMGLMKAVDHYRLQKGSGFSTYATWWIKQSIRRSIDNQAKTIRIPSYALENIKKWVKNCERVQAKLGHNPTITEVAANMNLSSKEIKNLIYATEVMKGETSLDQMITDDENLSMGDVVADKNKDASPEQVFMLLKQKEGLEELLTMLNEKEKRIISERFGLSGGEIMTLKELGEELGVSRERVRQIEETAINKMRIFAKQKNIL